MEHILFLTLMSVSCVAFLIWRGKSREMKLSAPFNIRDFMIRKIGSPSFLWEVKVQDGHFQLTRVFGRSREFTLSDIHSLSYTTEDRITGGPHSSNKTIQVDTITLYSKTEVLLQVESNYIGYRALRELLVTEGLLERNQKYNANIPVLRA